MTWKTYCGNLLWQSGLTLLAPVSAVDAEQNKFDDETRHGVDSDKEAEWEKKYDVH